MLEYDKRAKLVGKINFQYAYIDYQISNIIWNVLKLDKQAGIIVTGSLDIRPKIAMAIDLLDYYKKYDTLFKFLKTFKNRVQADNGIITRRNLLVHGVYSSRDNDPIVMIESHRSRKHSRKKPITVEYMEKVLSDINEEIDLLIKLMEEYAINLD